MRPQHFVAPAVAAAVSLLSCARAQTADAPEKSLGMVTVSGGAATSLPTEIPATVEGLTREQIERSINATDSEDALKYLPSLLVRKRYAGDYNHAVLSSRASGTGNSARSLVYADGILLSNLLGNGVGGLGFPPRWGLVTPQEIERVDVLYGPFSAAYPGNSAGAVVEYTTRMPTAFEAHGRVGFVSQPYELLGVQATVRSWETGASVGSAAGGWSWWLNLQRTDSESPPQTFATRTVSSGVPGAAGTPVSGAVAGRDASGAPWWVVGAATRYRTQQDHLKLKLAYDLTPTLRAAYTLGWWGNTARSAAASLLRDAAGGEVSRGAFNLDGRSFAGLTGADLPLTRETLGHAMHGLSVKSRTRGVFDWEFSASAYDYAQDERRQSAAANPLPAAALGGDGTVADGSGSGWTTLALKGTWRPHGPQGAHIVDAGLQQARYRLRWQTRSTVGSWIDGAPGALVNAVGGTTELTSAWAQDRWRLAPRWQAVLGARLEQWRARAGFTRIPGAAPAVNTDWPDRREAHVSPKAALSWQWRPDTVLKLAAGRAVRMPTAGELYGATSTANARYINDPNLLPERSWTTELSAEQVVGEGLLRLTWFAEDTRDALYSQTSFDAAANQNVTRVQNVRRIATQGLELAYTGENLALRGLDITASATFTDSVIRENDGFVALPGDTLGKRQPNIPRWRASGLATYRWSDRLSTSLGARYSGAQFRTLNNADVNGDTYMGVSRFFTVDLRAQYKASRGTTVALGIDNLGNARYWNFHPYPQRSYVAQLQVDL